MSSRRLAMRERITTFILNLDSKMLMLNVKTLTQKHHTKETLVSLPVLLPVNCLTVSVSCTFHNYANRFLKRLE